MVHVSHEIWMLGIVVLLVGILVLKVVIRRIKTGRMDSDIPAAEQSSMNHQDIEHRALMYLMAEKTDSLLGALAKTIEQERQKLGGVVRNPSMADSLDRLKTAAAATENGRASNYDAVGTMVQQGMDAAAIAAICECRRRKSPW